MKSGLEEYMQQEMDRLKKENAQLVEALALASDQLETLAWDQRLPSGHFAIIWATTLGRIINEAIAKAKGDTK
jgi:hypothetical protein